MQSQPNIDAEKILNEFGNKTKFMIRAQLASIYSDPAKRSALTNANDQDHASYALLAMCCDDVNNLNLKRLSAAIGYLKEKDVKKRVIKSLEITQEYLRYNTAQISPERFASFLTTSAASEHAPLILLPNAILADMNLSRKNIDYSYANFRGANLNNSRLNGSNLDHADFTFCVTSGADYTDCTLTHTNFSKCKLEQMKFGKPAAITPTTIILDNEDFLDIAKLNKFLDTCINLNIPPTYALNAVKRNFQYLGHKPKTYDYEDKLSLWKSMAKHKLFTDKANRHIKEDVFCTVKINNEMKSVKENINAREEKKRMAGRNFNR